MRKACLIRGCLAAWQTDRLTDQPTNQQQDSPSWEANRSSDNDSPHFAESGFIIVFTRANHWSPSWARWIHSTFSLEGPSSPSVLYGSNCSELCKNWGCMGPLIHFNVICPSTPRSSLQVFQPPKPCLSGDMIRNFICQKGNSQRLR